MFIIPISAYQHSLKPARSFDERARSVSFGSDKFIRSCDKEKSSSKIQDLFESLLFSLNFEKGRTKIPDTVKLKLRSSEENVDVSVDKVGDTYSLYSKEGQELGAMKLDKSFHRWWRFDNFFDAYVKDAVYVESLCTVNRGKNASKYRGIGTELLKIAVLESKNLGHGGKIFLEAAHPDVSPTPFYYNCGLRFIDDRKNPKMEDFLHGKGDFDELISNGMMYLPQENISDFLSLN